MNNLLFLIKLALLFLSITGYGMLLHKKLKITPAFIPLLIFTSITTLIFGSGLINVMKYMASIIFFTGMILFFVFFYQIVKNKHSIKNYISIPTLFIISFSIFLILNMKGFVYYKYDDFSHWGLIAKEIIIKNALPQNPTMITFKNYPPGAAVFIYYFCYVVGYSEGTALMAQGLLLGSAFTSLFALCNVKNKHTIPFYLTAVLILLLLIPDNLYTLQVDTLLGVLALASAFISYYYRDKWVYSILINIPILITIILVKDSGKIFFIFNVLLILFFTLRSLTQNKNYLSLKREIARFGLFFILLVVLPLLFNFVWIKYTEKVYSKILTQQNKFAVSKTKLSSGLTAKSEEFKQQLLPKLIKASINTKRSNVQFIILLDLFALLVFVLLYVTTKRFSNHIINTLLYVHFIYMIYMISVYFMYLFLMPEQEARYLAGFTRYQATIFIYIGGLLMLAIFYEIDQLIEVSKKRIYPIIISFLVISTFMLPFYKQVKSAYLAKHITSLPLYQSRYNAMHKLGNITSFLDRNDRVLIFSPRTTKDNGYLFYQLRHELLSHNFSIQTRCNTLTDQQNITTMIRKSTYLVVLDSDENFNKFLLKSRFIQTKNELTDIYAIKYKDDQIRLQPLYRNGQNLTISTLK